MTVLTRFLINAFHVELYFVKVLSLSVSSLQLWVEQYCSWNKKLVFVFLFFFGVFLFDDICCS